MGDAEDSGSLAESGEDSRRYGHRGFLGRIIGALTPSDISDSHANGADPSGSAAMPQLPGTGNLRRMRVEDVMIPKAEIVSVPVDITVFGGLAYFGADDSVVIHDDQTATYDRELFRTDGTDAGTLRVKDINPGPEPSIPFGFTEWGDQLYFRATGPGHGAEL